MCSKEELEDLIITKNLPYEKIGRMFDVSGNAVKKWAIKYGIELKPKRRISECEIATIRKRSTLHRKVKVCLYCGKEFYGKHSNQIYCCSQCSSDDRYKKFIEKWLSGECSGYLPKCYSASDTIRRYMLQRANYRCEICGFEGVNVSTKNTILQLHHKDGDFRNNKIENLQIICPNCHAMTENFGSLNHNDCSERTRYYKRDAEGVVNYKINRIKKHENNI